VDKRFVHGTANGRNAGRARKTAAVNDRSLTDAPVVGGPMGSSDFYFLFFWGQFCDVDQVAIVHLYI
jgi:hypothetical protein